MSTSGSERTEKPTPRRLRDARNKGQVAVSRDLATAVSFVGALAALVATLPEARGLVTAATVASVSRACAGEDLDVLSAWKAVDGAVWMMLAASLPVGLAALCGGVMATFLQTRFLATGSTAAVKLERLNPISGFKRLVAARTFVELAKTWIKVAAIGVAAAVAVLGDGLAGLVACAWAEPGDAFLVAARLSMTAALAVAAASVAIGGADVLLQRWLHERELRMTKDDVRRDQKEEEGDPLIKHARKQIHRELALSTMLRAARSASFVAVNPTHLSVAVSYDAGRDDAPRIVAKGAGEIARRIRREAELSGVRIVRDKPLARALYAVPVDSEIPEELYVAVAETLAFIAETAEGKPNEIRNQNPER